jgi:hypothetical protein
VDLGKQQCVTEAVSKVLAISGRGRWRIRETFVKGHNISVRQEEELPKIYYTS